MLYMRTFPRRRVDPGFTLPCPAGVVVVALMFEEPAVAEDGAAKVIRGVSVLAFETTARGAVAATPALLLVLA